MPGNKNILILGIGNYLMGDEGVGVHTANRLLQSDVPPGADIVDGGTGGFHYWSILKPTTMLYWLMPRLTITPTTPYG